jgi:hypothetical protein
MRPPMLLRFIVLTALLAMSGTGFAQTPTAPAPTGAPTGNTDTKGGTVAAQPPPNITIPSCTEPSPNPSTMPPPVSVTVNPATTWQPRGGEVIVAVLGDASLFKGFTVRACFGWSSAPPSTFFGKDNLAHFNPAFVRIRPSDKSGLVNLGIVVPDLDNAPVGFTGRWRGKAPATGLGMVPIVDMRLIGYNEAGVLFDIVRPVGVTSVTFSFIAAVIGLTIGVVVLHRLAIERTPVLSPAPARGAPAQNAAGSVRNKAYPAMTRALGLLNFKWFLFLVRRGDGRASLSAFQILLWTLVVVGSAIYVMALSGNLIDITPGTLVLLGIAGAAGLISAVQGSGVAAGAAGQSQQPPQPVVNPPDPMWSDLVRDEDDRPDVTRLQMLFFTVVTAVFVLMQVVNNYVIPDIPSGYLVLMGISNGIYVGRKFTGPPGAPGQS